MHNYINYYSLNDLVQITTLHSLMQILLLFFIWNTGFSLYKKKSWFNSVKHYNWSVLKWLTLHEFIPVTTISLLQNFFWYSFKFCINTLCKYRSVKLLKLQSFQFYSICFLYFSLSAQSRNWRNIIVMLPICDTKSNSDKLTTSVSDSSPKKKHGQSFSTHSTLTTELSFYSES